MKLCVKSNKVQGANKKESSIRLNLQFNKFDRSTLDSKLLSDTPYLYIFFTECSDGDLYKEKFDYRFYNNKSWREVSLSSLVSSPNKGILPLFGSKLINFEMKEYKNFPYSVGKFVEIRPISSKTTRLSFLSSL